MSNEARVLHVKAGKQPRSKEEEEQKEEEGGAAAGIERQEVERLLAQEVLKSRLLLSPFEEFALTLDFKLSKVARAAIPLLPSVSSLSNHPNRVARKKTAAYFEARNSRPGTLRQKKLLQRHKYELRVEKCCSCTSKIRRKRRRREGGEKEARRMRKFAQKFNAIFCANKSKGFAKQSPWSRKSRTKFTSRLAQSDYGVGREGGTHTHILPLATSREKRTQPKPIPNPKPGGANTKVQFWELMNWRINFDETFIARQRNG